MLRTYLTIDEVAESLRVTVATVRWLRQAGKFAPAIKIGRRLVWDEIELQAWLRSSQEASVRFR